MDKLIHLNCLLKCAPSDAFNYFVREEKLQQWLCKKASVEPVEGGKYELFWQPDHPAIDSSIGCKILAIDPPDLINFEWKGPQQFDKIMNHQRPLTNVTIVFIPRGKETKVAFVHSGWGEGEVWEDAREFFVKAWSGAFEKLESLINHN